MRQPLIAGSFQFIWSHRVTLTLQERKSGFLEKQRNSFQLWNSQCFKHNPNAHIQISVFTSPALHVETCVQTSKNPRHALPNCTNKIFFLQLMQGPNPKSCFLAISSRPLHWGNASRMCCACPSVRAEAGVSWHSSCQAPQPGVGTQGRALPIPPGAPKPAVGSH